MTLHQGPRGKIELFSDFFGPEVAVAGTTAGPINFFPFMLVGTGLNANDSGAVSVAGQLSGGVQLISKATDNNGAFFSTEVMFDVALNAPIVIEARIQMASLADGRAFVGFTNDSCDSAVGVVMEANTGTVTNTMTNFVGFLWDSGATLSTTWLYGYNGGTTAALVTEQTTGKIVAAGEYDVMRIEISNNGDAEFFINGERITKIKGAISTTTDIGALCGIQSTTSAVSEATVDYLLVTAYRDWTV